jgi:hypothetical protein
LSSPLPHQIMLRGAGLHHLVYIITSNPSNSMRWTSPFLSLSLEGHQCSAELHATSHPTKRRQSLTQVCPARLSTPPMN